MSETTIKSKAARKPSPASVATEAPAAPAELPPIAKPIGVQIITHLKQAQELPEIDADTPALPADQGPAAIAFFKGEDRRTMRVVFVAGRLAQQAIQE